MNVPFLDFSQQYQEIKGEMEAGLQELYKRQDFILGKDAKEFEKEFAGYCGVKYGVGVNSGTDALYIALSSLKLKPGDEVIVPTHTFIATALCISYTGAKPVFVDIEEKTYNMDPAKMKAAITAKTKVIMPVQLYGQIANMDEILAIAKKHNITVVEDACQAHGAEYKGKKAGSIGDIGCFSFYPTKSLGAFGDGGMIVTNSEAVAEQAKMLRDYGREDRYNHKIKGFNSRLDTMQAVILRAKLKRLDQWNKMRGEHAAYYCQLLKDTPQVKTPFIDKDRLHVFQTFAVRVPKRDQVIEVLKAKGISALIHYPIPLHLQKAYADMGHKKGDFPVAEKVADEILSLPMFPHMTKEQVEAVCNALKEVV